ncbi:MAG: hypothetical protein IJ587_12510 [Synergistaceae bacterium]|nr:hypothetical protein [Synergistaceae bacterium]
MKIYLDNCCFNRPYDMQSSFRISLETQAKLYIQEEIRKGHHELVCSYMLVYENSQNRDAMRKAAIKSYQDNFCSYYVPFTREKILQEKITEIMSFNISFKDAVHVACAIYAECDYLITTDIRLQRRYKGTEIKIVNPLEFIVITEEKGENI